MVGSAGDCERHDRQGAWGKDNPELQLAKECPWIQRSISSYLRGQR